MIQVNSLVVTVASVHNKIFKSFLTDPIIEFWVFRVNYETFLRKRTSSFYNITITVLELCPVPPLGFNNLT